MTHTCPITSTPFHAPCRPPRFVLTSCSAAASGRSLAQPSGCHSNALSAYDLRNSSLKREIVACSTLYTAAGQAISVQPRPAQLHKQIYYYLVSPQAWDMYKNCFSAVKTTLYYSSTLNCTGCFYLNVTGLTLGQVRNICSVFWSAGRDLSP